MGKNLLTASNFAAGMNSLNTQLRDSYVRLNNADYKNIIDVIKVNSSTLVPVNKTVNIEVPTKVSDLTNDSNFQTKTEVDNAISTAISTTYKAGGSVATVAELPTLSKNVLGYVYDFTAEFTTTADFKEGAGKKYPIGSNVVVADIDTTGLNPTYKFDVLPGFVDLSDYLDTSSAGTGIKITPQKKISIDPDKFLGYGGIDIKINNDIVSTSLSASTINSLTKASSALQLGDVTTTSTSGISLDKTNNKIDISAKLKPTSSNFVNALKKDANGMYVELDYATKAEVEAAVNAAFENN